MTLVSSLLVLALVTPAQTQTSAQDEVDQLHTEGLVLYRAGKYKQALPKFEEAYRKFPDATILFNVGKCLEALGELDRAIGTYRAVANQPNAEPELVTRAKTRVETLETAKLKSRTEALDDAPKSQPATVAAPPPAAAITAKAENGSWMTVGKWTFLGAGAAVAVGGGVAFALGYRDHQKIDRAIDAAGPNGLASLTQSQAEDLLSSGSTKKNIGYGLMGAGAAVVAFSTVLFVLDGDAEPSMSVSGMASADGAGAILRGRF